VSEERVGAGMGRGKEKEVGKTQHGMQAKGFSWASAASIMGLVAWLGRGDEGGRE
jgi:hypothetical protein